MSKFSLPRSGKVHAKGGVGEGKSPDRRCGRESPVDTRPTRYSANAEAERERDYLIANGDAILRQIFFKDRDWESGDIPSRGHFALRFQLDRSLCRFHFASVLD